MPSAPKRSPSLADGSPQGQRRRLVLPAALWSSLLSLLVLAPTLPVGFVLLRDMVFTPRQPFTPAAFGLGSALPRAVPVDAVMAAVTAVVPGMLVQKFVLVATLALAGLGAALLVPSRRALTRCAGATLYVWNAYVAERLLLGHWSLLVAYAALPWLVRGALRLRAGTRGAAVVIVLLLGVSALTPGGGLLTALTLLPLLLWRGSSAGRGPTCFVLAGLVLVNAPWWLPATLVPGGAGSSAAGVDAFAARAELPLGVLGSLVGLGGAWNADAVPTSRDLLPATLLAILIPVAAAFGWQALREAWGRGASAVAVSAGLGLLLAWAGAVPVLAPVLRWTVVNLPGGGLLRDGQRLVAPLALLLAVAAPLGLERLARRSREPAGRTAILLVPLLLPLLVLPDLAWGAWGRLQPVTYPSDWPQVRSILVADPPGPTSGDVVVVPWQTFRQFAWNRDRTIQDPAPRYLDRTTVVDDTLVVGDLVVRGEDRRAAAVGAAVRSAVPAVRSLPPLGIGWVLVEKGTPGDVPPSFLDGATPVLKGHDLWLYRLGDGSGDGKGWGSGAVAPGPGTVSTVGSVAVLGVDLLALLLLAGCAGAIALSRRGAAARVEST